MIDNRPKEQKKAFQNGAQDEPKIVSKLGFPSLFFRFGRQEGPRGFQEWILMDFCSFCRGKLASKMHHKLILAQNGGKSPGVTKLSFLNKVLLWVFFKSIESNQQNHPKMADKMERINSASFCRQSKLKTFQIRAKTALDGRKQSPGWPQSKRRLHCNLQHKLHI